MLQLVNNKSRTKGRRIQPGVWAAYAACFLAFAYAGVSFYGAAGGTAGLSTLGGTLEELGRARELALSAAVWAVGVLKALAALLALALIRPWGRRLPHRMVLAVVLGRGDALNPLWRLVHARRGTRGGGCDPGLRCRRLDGAQVARIPVGPVVPPLGHHVGSGGLPLPACSDPERDGWVEASSGLSRILRVLSRFW